MEEKGGGGELQDREPFYSDEKNLKNHTTKVSKLIKRFRPKIRNRRYIFCVIEKILIPSFFPLSLILPRFS